MSRRRRRDARGLRDRPGGMNDTSDADAHYAAGARARLRYVEGYSIAGAAAQLGVVASTTRRAPQRIVDPQSPRDRLTARSAHSARLGPVGFDPELFGDGTEDRPHRVLVT